MDLVGDTNIENALALPTKHARAATHKKHHKPHSDCQNCGTELVGDHCHGCGQHGHVHRSVLHVVEEVIHGITHLDSRAWRSLPMLAFRPGTLTRNYVMGRRARYVPPFAMFLFSIFAMFLVFAFSGGPNLVSKETATKAQSIESARDKLSESEADLKEAQSEVASAQNEVARVTSLTQAEPGELGAAAGELAGARGALVAAERAVVQSKADLAAAIDRPEVISVTKEGSDKSRTKVTLSFDDQTGRDGALAEIAKEKAKARLSGDAVEAGVLSAAEAVAKASPTNGVSTVVRDGSSDDIMEMLKESMREGNFINTPWPKLNEKIKYKTKNPDLFLYKLQNTAYKFSFLFVPLSLPFIWLMLFWKKDVTLFDHAVFALYSLSFVSFLFMLISFGGHWISPGWGFGAAAVILPIHIFYQFKGAYQLKWFSAFWRTSLFCLIFSWVIILAFFLSIIALGVTG